jgi:hypothetical protein
MPELVTNPDESLWRVILPQLNWIVADPNSDTGCRATSMAFLDSRSDELSVHVARMTSEDEVLVDFAGSGIAEFLARVPLDLGHSIRMEPPPPSHAVIYPPPTSGKKRKENARLMAMSARLRRLPQLLP